jgi:flavin-dependent dehydrogenase
MQSCDVLIVGGGPAGSSCAWGLRNAGLDIALWDRSVFPRDKVCGGWVTPEVFEALHVDPREYSREHLLQPISGFLVGELGCRKPVYIEYGRPVSYGIRRREFDTWLLRRCDACVREATPVTSLERTASGWIVNGAIHARLIVGAGGSSCPVARHCAPAGNRSAPQSGLVVAQEAEFEMDAGDAAACRVAGDTPELYFCPDLLGYGWCFRKGNVLNVGLGRADCRHLPEHVGAFLSFLRQRGRVTLQVPKPHGHSYLLSGAFPGSVAGDRYLLTGDAASLAYPLSGEGILPAVQSGLHAAEAIIEAAGDYSGERLRALAQSRSEGFVTSSFWSSAGAMLPGWLMTRAAGMLLRKPAFVKQVVLDRWFLHVALGQV